MNAYKNASFVGIILYLFGIVLIVYGLYNLGIEKKLDKEGLTAKGIVYELNVVEPYRQAWVEFTTADGKKVHFLDKLFWNQDFEKYKVGQEVEVIYNPADPKGTATINEFFQRNTAPWWPFVVGLIVIFVGRIMRRSMRKKARNYEGQRNGTIPYDPNASKKSLARIMWITFIFICLIILLFIVVFGYYGAE